VNAREDLELVAGEEKHGLGGAIDEHRMDVVSASIVIPGALPFAFVGLVVDAKTRICLLANVCINGEVVTTAVDVVVDHRRPVSEDPDTIMLVVKAAHPNCLDTNLDIIFALVAFSFSFKIICGGDVASVGTELCIYILTTPVGADLVVPAVGVSLPVFDLLVLIVEAEIEMDVREVNTSIDTAAHIGGTLGIRHFEHAASGTQGLCFQIFVRLVFVVEHVVEVRGIIGAIGKSLLRLASIPMVFELTVVGERAGIGVSRS